MRLPKQLTLFLCLALLVSVLGLSWGGDEGWNVPLASHGYGEEDVHPLEPDDSWVEDTGLVGAAMPVEQEALHILHVFMQAVRKAHGLEGTPRRLYRLPPLRQSDPEQLRTVHNVREQGETGERMFTWREVYDDVQEGGHRWCPLIRDNWACVGEHYVKVLQNTRQYNESLTLEHLPKGSILLVHGNSITANLFLPVLCYGQGLGSGWYLELVKSKNSYIYYTLSVSQHSIRDGMDGVIAIVLSNHNVFTNQSRTVEVMSAAGITPTHILAGKINGDERPMRRQTKFEEFQQAWPRAKITSNPGASNECVAEFKNCRDEQDPAHNCFPGPAMLRIEDSMRVLLGYKD